MQNPFELPEDESRLAGKGALRRTDLYRDAWRERRTEFVRDHERDQGAVVWFGDSLTQGWGELPKELFPGMHIANRGINSDTTRGMLYRVHEDVVKLRPRAVMLLMGTNDLKDEHSAADIAGNFKLIVDEIRGAQPEVPLVVCLVPPSSASRGRSAERVQELNRHYLEAVKGLPAVTVVDTFSLFATPSGECDPVEFPDLLHPSDDAYRRFAEALRPVFAQLGCLPARL